MSNYPNKDFTRPFIRLSADDNILIARVPLALGQRVEAEGLTVKAQVPAGHKIAATAIAKGMPVRKYNTVIGFASRDIAPGEHVHDHNIEFVEFERDPEFGLDVRPVDYVPKDQRATFMGIVRERWHASPRETTSESCRA